MILLVTVYFYSSKGSEYFFNHSSNQCTVVCRVLWWHQRVFVKENQLFTHVAIHLRWFHLVMLRFDHVCGFQRRVLMNVRHIFYWSLNTVGQVRLLPLHYSPYWQSWPQLWCKCHMSLHWLKGALMLDKLDGCHLQESKDYGGIPWFMEPNARMNQT